MVVPCPSRGPNGLPSHSPNPSAAMNHFRPLLFLPAFVVLLAACDAADPDPAGALSPVATDAAVTPLGSLTFCVDEDVNQSFQLEDFPLDLGGVPFFLTGGVHVVIRLRPDGLGGFDARGHANPQGLILEPADGSTLFRVVGSSNVRVNVAADDTTDITLRYRVIDPGQEPDFRAFLDLSAYVATDCEGVTVVVTGARLEEL
jgi:hypothetical protein